LLPRGGLVAVVDLIDHGAANAHRQLHAFLRNCQNGISERLCVRRDLLLTHAHSLVPNNYEAMRSVDIGFNIHYREFAYHQNGEAVYKSKN
jgi:hypothetical protein